MKYTEMKELATAELAERLAEEKANYMSMKLTHSLSPLENPMQIKIARKNIRIFEVGISYYGRTYEEGKKIGLQIDLL